jgi:outer membrane protein, multidrug efflux system
MNNQKWRTFMYKQPLWVALIAATLLSGCMVGPNYRTPSTAAPKTWSGLTATTQPATQPTTKPSTRPAGPTTRPAQVTTWWKSLKDPTLDSLLAEAVRANLDLRFATARVREARAQCGFVAADLWPQLNSSGSYQYRGSSRNAGPKTSGGLGTGQQARNTAVNSVMQAVIAGGAPAVDIPGTLGQTVASAVNNKLQGNGVSAVRDQNLFQAGFDASWELDVFGGTRRAVEAASDDIAASIESRRDVLVTLLAEVALDYVQLRGFQRRLAIAHENIRVQQDTVDLTQTRYKAGFISELDVAQAKAQLASTQSQVPAFESQIRQLIYQLSVLLGKPPAALVPILEKDGPIPHKPLEVPLGLPSDLLRRRPDIRTAERQLAAATARIGVATADLFPKFALTGAVGPQSRTVKHMLDQKSLAWSVGPGVSWPVFDGWRIRSNIEIQNALEEQALITYEKTVLTAFQDVESSLIAYTNEQVRHKSLGEAVAASQRSTDLSNELYTRGFTAFINVLQSQGTLYATEDQLVQSETNVITNLISLYKALGGGWEPPAPAQTIK